MRVYCVVTERDGATTKEPGRMETEMDRCEYRYVAESIDQVWEAVKGLHERSNERVMAILEEHSAAIVLSTQAEVVNEPI